MATLDVFTTPAPSLPCWYRSAMAGSTCKILNCDDTYQMRQGYCNKHYLRFRRHGSAHLGQAYRPKFSSPEEEFEARTIQTDHGLEWVGTMHTQGAYGKMRSGMLAHRYAWSRENGPIPPGHVIDHQPECPKVCVDHRHLTAYTWAQHASVGWERGELDGGWIRARRRPSTQDPKTGRFVRGNPNRL